MASSTADEKSGTEVLRLTYSPPEAPMQKIHVPSTACEVISFNLSRSTLSGNVCRVKRSYHNKHNSINDTGEEGKKPCNIDLKITMKILFHYPPTFPFI